MSGQPACPYYLGNFAEGGIIHRISVSTSCLTSLMKTASVHYFFCNTMIKESSSLALMLITESMRSFGMVVDRMYC